MNIIAKISCYLDSSVITLKLCKEYLNTVTQNTSVLLWIKNWTVWYIEHYSMSTYMGVTNCQKNGPFLAHLYIHHYRPQKTKWTKSNITFYKGLADTKRLCNCSVLCLCPKSSLCSCIHYILDDRSLSANTNCLPISDGREQYPATPLMRKD